MDPIYTPDCNVECVRCVVDYIFNPLPCPRGPVLRPNTVSPLVETSRGTSWPHLAPRLCSSFHLLAEARQRHLSASTFSQAHTHSHTHYTQPLKTHTQVGGSWCMEQRLSLLNLCVFLKLILLILSTLLQGKYYMPTLGTLLRQLQHTHNQNLEAC